ncbi:GNAT family N-acetyltransferase [Arachidicoccus terrestris]|uniref:GNAT family N-acetyltransferase n=1 Tax=Arachidicoccus terrestris TaxID=2875539 RepID=UPI001CC43162|nr:GNAT family N-acetyltransferase [Arachidicoccus terrestris]UAY56725.1 GNAT family N-acetyltransferase [Arachidicoccus terrestris]
MKIANRADKELIVDILAKSFEANRSINYIVKQDEKRFERIRILMGYSFEMCYLFGKVLLSIDENACALILYPQKKKSSIRTILLDAKLIFRCVGLRNLKKTLSRESVIKRIQPEVDMVYLWFIGTHPCDQNRGIGTALMSSVIQIATEQHLSIYLETSTLKNLPWYEKFGFEIYDEFNLGYRLFFLRRLFRK